MESQSNLNRSKIIVFIAYIEITILLFFGTRSFVLHLAFQPLILLTDPMSLFMILGFVTNLLVVFTKKKSIYRISKIAFIIFTCTVLIVAVVSLAKYNNPLFWIS